MVTGCSVMITPGSGMIKTQFLDTMGMFYFRIIGKRERPQKEYDDEQIFQYNNE